MLLNGHNKDMGRASDSMVFAPRDLDWCISLSFRRVLLQWSCTRPRTLDLVLIFNKTCQVLSDWPCPVLSMSNPTFGGLITVRNSKQSCDAQSWSEPNAHSHFPLCKKLVNLFVQFVNLSNCYQIDFIAILACNTSSKQRKCFHQQATCQSACPVCELVKLLPDRFHNHLGLGHIHQKGNGLYCRASC